MKKVLVLPFLAAIACAPVSSFGQSPAPAGSAAGPHEHGGISSLSPEERDTLKAANLKAQQDPAVQAAFAKLQVARKAAGDAMVAKDKSLAPLLDKIQAASSPGAERIRLTADEREQLRTARESIKGTPEADAVEKALTEYRDALHKAMIAADPAVAAILEKLPQGGMGHGLGGPPKPAASAAASPQ